MMESLEGSLGDIQVRRMAKSSHPLRIVNSQTVEDAPPRSLLKQWHPWRAPIGQWGAAFAPTDYVAH